MNIGAFIVYIVLEVFEAEIGFLVMANDLRDAFHPPLQGGCCGKDASHMMEFAMGIPEAMDAAFEVCNVHFPLNNHSSMKISSRCVWVNTLGLCICPFRSEIRKTSLWGGLENTLLLFFRGIDKRPCFQETKISLQ